MASMAKLQKSFQDYFRIPILLKPLGSTSIQTLNKICITLNQINNFPLSQQIKDSQIQLAQFTKHKKTPLYSKLKIQLQQRNIDECQKLLFLSQDFYNQWSQFQIIYKSTFVILVYQQQQQSQDKQNINQKIQKLRIKLKDKQKNLLGIIFLNDIIQFNKQKFPTLKFTILPPSLPLQQLSMFLQPWLSDLIKTIQTYLLFQIIQCREQQNSVIVFNRSEDKSQPKIMKKKKKFRSIKLAADYALVLHLYTYAYQSYEEAEDQLKKIDDYLWMLGCIQGKIACMTSNDQNFINNHQKIDKKIDQLITQSFITSKKIKYFNFQVQNFFKIIKLFISDKQRFDEMLQNFLSNLKGLNQQQKFIFYCYIGSLYQKCDMQRKRNYFYYKANLITQNYKPQLSQLLLKTIISSKYMKKWQFLYAQTLQKIIQQQKYFSKYGEIHLQIIEKCSNVLTDKQIKQTLNYLNYSNYEQTVLKTDQLIQIKQFIIEESLIKPKLNRLLNDQSPKKTSTGVFMGWKKKQIFIYEQDQPIIFKGTIINKLPFQINIKLTIQLQNCPLPITQFRLILPANQPYKFQRSISFSYNQKIIIIKQLKLKIFNFIIYKSLQPQINFQLYQKQPIFQLSIEDGKKFIDEENKEKIMIEFEESSSLTLNGQLKRINKVQCEKIRITCSIYYNIDVGFQENQYNLSLENSFCNIKFNNYNKNYKNINHINNQNNINNNEISNIRFVESQQKQSSIQFNQKQQILIFKLKKFKASRNHIKRIQISLDYIKSKQSKYQINKIYYIETKIINSIWGQIMQISTPELQKNIKKLQNPSQSQIQKLKINWNLIQKQYIVKLKFLKDQYNLKPFKIIYEQQNLSLKQSKLQQPQQVILSNLTQGQMSIKLPKYHISLQQKKQIILHSNMETTNNILQPIQFKWQNIVNKKMYGSFKINQKINPLIFNPKFDIIVNLNKKQVQTFNKTQLYELIYTIKGQIRPHQIKVKNYQQNQDQSNMTILLKGKTKINKINNNNLLSHYYGDNKNKNNDKFNQFNNKLQLRIIFNNSQKRKKQEKVVFVIEFEEKDMGRLEKEIILR